MPKQCFIAVACNSKSLDIILWHVIRVKLNIGFCASLTLMCLLPNTISLTHHIKFCTGNNSMPNKHWHVWGCESAVTHHSLTGLFTGNIKFIFPEIRKASDKLNLG